MLCSILSKRFESVGTPRSPRPGQAGAAFWMPELNMSETKKAKAIVDSIGAKKKK